MEFWRGTPQPFPVTDRPEAYFCSIDLASKAGYLIAVFSPHLVADWLSCTFRRFGEEIKQAWMLRLSVLSLAKMQSAFIFIALRHDTCLWDQLALNR